MRVRWEHDLIDALERSPNMKQRNFDCFGEELQTVGLTLDANN